MIEPLDPNVPQLQNVKGDTPLAVDRNDLQIDEADLVKYCLESFKNSIRDKEQFGWIEKREYEIKAYYQIKNDALGNWPWKGACKSRVPLTPSIVDTAVANLKAGIRSEEGHSVKVRGVGPEDERTAPMLNDYMNWKINNDTDITLPMGSNTFRTVMHGTGFMKVLRNLDNTISVVSLDSENVYASVDCEGLTIDQCEGVHHVIGLTWRDLLNRQDVYKDWDKIVPGMGILEGQDAAQRLEKLRDKATGTSVDQRMRRDIYFIVESQLTYCPKSGSGYGGGPSRAGVRPVELIVWFSPNGGRIHRVKKNDEGFRTIVDYYLYDTPGRLFKQSLPEKIRGLQEDIDYANKQYTDALDRSISPAMFVDDTTDFERGKAQRVPGGIYKTGVGQGSTIKYEPTPAVDRGFWMKIADLWAQAERVSGVTDVAQGAQTVENRTLGETQIRSMAAGVRQNSLFENYGKGWKKSLEIVYEYCNRYEDRKKKLRVLGYRDLTTVEEIFPAQQGAGLGIKGKFDWGFGGMPEGKRQEERQNKIMLANELMLNPLVQSDPATAWKVEKMRAEARGTKNFEVLVNKPKGVDIYSAEEFIQRVVSGQHNIQIRPGIDTEDYLFEIELYMRSESFGSLDPRGQKALMDARRRAYIMGVFEKRAMMDLAVIQQGMAIQGMPQGQMPQEQAVG